MAEVIVGGTLANLLPGTVANLQWSSRWGSGPCGPEKASWVQSLPFLYDDPRLVPGARVSIVRGGQTLWAGVLSDVQRGDPWTFDANGLSQVAGDYLAQDASGVPTNNIGTATSQAVARGLPWTGTAFNSLGTFGTASATDYPSIPSLLTGYHDRNGLRWGVNVYGVTFSTADSTTPVWVLDGKDVEVGIAENELYTAVVARYQSGTTGAGTPEDPVVAVYSTTTVANASAIARYGRREYPLNLTDLGTISSGTASTYATQVLNALVAPAWINQITVTADRLTSPGGVPADLASVQAGQAVRVIGVPGRIGRLSGSGAMVVGLGQVSYTDGADEITLAPIRLARRTLAQVLDRFAQIADAQRALQTA